MRYWHPYLEHYLVIHAANDNDDSDLWVEYMEELRKEQIIEDDYNDIELEYEIEDITSFSDQEGNDVPF